MLWHGFLSFHLTHPWSPQQWAKFIAVLFPDSISGFPLVGKKEPNVRLFVALWFLSAWFRLPCCCRCLSVESIDWPQTKTEKAPLMLTLPVEKGAFLVKSPVFFSTALGHAERCGLPATGGRGIVSWPSVSLKGGHPGKCQRKSNRNVYKIMEAKPKLGETHPRGNGEGRPWHKGKRELPAPAENSLHSMGLK